MHILITDSGVGGLSVVAYAERFVRTRGFTEPVRLTFANAAPANDFGYNSMKSKEEKLATFGRFLHNVTGRYTPDRIYVACNTLSVLLPDVERGGLPPVSGIVNTAVDLIVNELDTSSVAMIFATQTTVDAGAYPRLLSQRGVGPARIVTQACPGLADTISEDREGRKTAEEIGKWVRTAVAKMPDRNAHIVACLACTHYGYRKDIFAAALGPRAQVINPNERAVDDLFVAGGGVHEVSVRFITRYAIPQTTIDALTYFLEDISPRTVAAMRNFEHVPDLF